MLGFTKVIKFKWVEIAKIQIKGQDGILVELRQGKDREVSFSGIKDRVKVINFLLKLWRNANEVDSESEISESDRE